MLLLKAETLWVRNNSSFPNYFCMPTLMFPLITVLHVRNPRHRVFQKLSQSPIPCLRQSSAWMQITVLKLHCFLHYTRLTIARCSALIIMMQKKLPPHSGFFLQVSFVLT